MMRLYYYYSFKQEEEVSWMVDGYMMHTVKAAGNTVEQLLGPIGTHHFFIDKFQVRTGLLSDRSGSNNCS
jgi:hypothetical protein